MLSSEQAGELTQPRSACAECVCSCTDTCCPCCCDSCKGMLFCLMQWCGLYANRYEHASTAATSRASSALGGGQYQAPSPPSRNMSASASRRHSPDRPDQERTALLGKGMPSSTELRSTATGSGGPSWQDATGPGRSDVVHVDGVSDGGPGSARMHKRLQSVENIMRMAESKPAVLEASACEASRRDEPGQRNGAALWAVQCVVLAFLVQQGARESPRTAKVPARLLVSGEDDEDDTCPTCLEGYTDENPKIMTKCHHHFHLGCIYEWLERSQTCPVCSREMSFDEVL